MSDEQKKPQQRQLAPFTPEPWGTELGFAVDNPNTIYQEAVKSIRCFQKDTSIIPFFFSAMRLYQVAALAGHPEARREFSGWIKSGCVTEGGLVLLAPDPALAGDYAGDARSAYAEVQALQIEQAQAYAQLQEAMGDAEVNKTKVKKKTSPSPPPTPKERKAIFQLACFYYEKALRSYNELCQKNFSFELPTALRCIRKLIKRVSDAPNYLRYLIQTYPALFKKIEAEHGVIRKLELDSKWPIARSLNLLRFLKSEGYSFPSFEVFLRGVPFPNGSDYFWEALLGDSNKKMNLHLQTKDHSTLAHWAAAGWNKAVLYSIERSAPELLTARNFYYASPIDWAKANEQDEAYKWLFRKIHCAARAPRPSDEKGASVAAFLTSQKGGVANLGGLRHVPPHDNPLRGSSQSSSQMNGFSSSSSSDS